MLLNNYLPDFLTNTKTFSDSINAQQIQVDSINNNIADITAQGFVETATWGLNQWESMLGITTDLTKSFDDRRIKIISVIRGYGSVTKTMLENLLKSMPYGDADITENSALSNFVIEFNNYYTIPSNIPDILETVDIIKPAHLAYSYTFAYNWWDLIESKNITWDCGKTWDELRTYGEV